MTTFSYYRFLVKGCMLVDVNNVFVQKLKKAFCFKLGERSSSETAGWSKSRSPKISTAASKERTGSRGLQTEIRSYDSSSD